MKPVVVSVKSGLGARCPCCRQNSSSWATACIRGHLDRPFPRLHPVTTRASIPPLHHVSQLLRWWHDPRTLWLRRSPIHSRGLYEDQHSCVVVSCRSGIDGNSASGSTGIGRSRGPRRPGCRARAGRQWIFQLPPPSAPSGRGALRPTSDSGGAAPSPPREALETQRIPRGNRLLHRRPVLRPSGLGPPAGS